MCAALLLGPPVAPANAVEPPPQTSAPAWGRTVLDIRIETGARMTAQEFVNQITVRKGQPLEPAAVSRTLKNLYATGRFQELRADAEEQPGGVILVFRGQARFFVGIVSVEGAPPRVDAAALASASRLRLGQPISSQDLAEAASRLKALLADNAYYESKIRVSQTPHPDTQVADIVFTVEPGPSARLSGVEVTGNAGVPTSALAKFARWRQGIYLTSARVDRGLSSIRKYYAERGRLEATASAQGRAYDAKSRTERLTVWVDPGPLVTVRVAGARIPSSELKHILPIYRDGTADELSLAEGARKLEYYLQRKGYFSARAQAQKQTAPDGQKLEITYIVTPGERGQFAGYAFAGNRSVPASELAAVVQIQPAVFPLAPRGLFDRNLLDRDTQSLAALYHSRGFLEARVASELNDHFGDEPNHLFVTFRVIEGPQTLVQHVSLHGAGAALDQQLLRFSSSLLTRAGQPFSPERARADQNSILGYLADRGYSEARATWKASPPTPEHRVDVEYDLQPGRPQTIERVVLMGNRYTRESVIDRQLTIQAGAPLNPTHILDSRQRLYDLGLFNQVQIATEDPASVTPAKTVLVNVEEAKRWTLIYGGGLDVQRLPNTSNTTGKYSASPRVSLEADRLNLFGRPQSLALRGHFSNLEKIGSAGYSIPQFLNQRTLTFRLEGLYDQSRNVETFNSKREEASVGVQKQYSAHASLLVRYSFRKVEVSNLQIQPQSIPLFSQPVRVAMVSASYANDRRDNPVDATRGSYSLADFGIASSKLGSQADFARLSGQNSSYYRLRPYLVFARNTELGFEATYGQTISGDVPLPERFFMGGSESHRGFSLNQAGPRDPITGFPVGGQALFLNQFELRLPVEENRLGFVLFNDAGNVFSTVGHMRLFKFSQSSPTDLDYDVEAVGAGVRYQTPVGPVRFDVGYALNPPRFQQCTEDVTICPQQNLVFTRLPRIQLQLSIGQSF